MSEASAAASSVSASDPAQAEQRRAKYGVWVVIAGLALIDVLYIVTLLVFSTALPSSVPGGDIAKGGTSSDLSAVASSIVAAMGAVTGVIGSVVAAYFGIQLGSSGKERSDAAAEKSGAVAQAAMNKVPESVDTNEIARDAQSLLGVTPTTPPPRSVTIPPESGPIGGPRSGASGAPGGGPTPPPEEAPPPPTPGPR